MSDLQPETVNTLYPAYALERYKDATETWLDSSTAAEFLESLPSIAQDPSAYIEQAEKAGMTSLGALDLAYQHAAERGAVAYSVVRAALVAAERRREGKAA